MRIPSSGSLTSWLLFSIQIARLTWFTQEDSVYYIRANYRYWRALNLIQTDWMALQHFHIFLFFLFLVKFTTHYSVVCVCVCLLFSLPYSTFRMQIKSRFQSCQGLLFLWLLSLQTFPWLVMVFFFFPSSKYYLVNSVSNISRSPNNSAANDAGRLSAAWNRSFWPHNYFHGQTCIKFIFFFLLQSNRNQTEITLSARKSWLQSINQSTRFL